MRPKEPTENECHQQQANEQCKCLVSNVVFRVGAQQGCHNCCANEAKTGRREPPTTPIPHGRSRAVKAINEMPKQRHAKTEARCRTLSYAGTLTFLRTSSTTPRAVNPENRACGSITSRCAITLTA